MKAHYEKLKGQILAIKDTVARFIQQADGVIKQAEQANPTSRRRNGVNGTNIVSGR